MPRRPPLARGFLKYYIRIYIFSILSAVRSYQLCIKDKRLFRCLWLNMCIYIHNYMVEVFILDQEGEGCKRGRWDGNLAAGNGQSHTCSTAVIVSFEYRILSMCLLPSNRVREKHHQSLFNIVMTTFFFSYP